MGELLTNDSQDTCKSLMSDQQHRSQRSLVSDWHSLVKLGQSGSVYLVKLVSKCLNLTNHFLEELTIIIINKISREDLNF